MKDALGEKVALASSSLERVTNATVVSWAFNISDTRPFSPREPIGAIFLATNMGYFVSSAYFFQTASTPGFYFSGLIDLAGVVSFFYHYTQLQLGPWRSEVKLALLLDYVVAITSVISVLAILSSFVKSGYISESHVIEATACGSLSLVFLFASWFQQSLNYLVLHGLWHLISSIAVYKLAEAENLLHVL